MVRNVRTMVLGVILLLSGATVSGQTLLYVDASATGPGHDGSSWCTAFTELHEALDGAMTGSVIRVADGVYWADATGLGDPREATFALSSGVTIEGGYAGCGAPDPNQRDIEQNETILSGDLLANDPDIDDYRGCCNSTFLPGCPDEVCAAAVCAEQSLCCDIQWQTSCAELAPDLCSNLCPLKDDNTYHVLTASGTDATAVLDGVTITAGFANDATTSVEKAFGAGMYIQGGSPTLKNTVFRQNDATIHGAGLYVNVGSPTVIACLFEDNRAAGYHPDRVARGGGAYVHGGDPVFIDCTFTNNWGAPFAGGIFLSECGGVIRDCRVVDNVGTALECNRSNPQITDCIFARNGGGIRCTPFSSPTIRNCFILGNFASGVLCAVFSNPEITNCVIAGNFSGGSGGGIECLVCSAVITNCTIVGNSTFGDGGGIHVDGGDAPRSRTVSFGATRRDARVPRRTWETSGRLP